MSSNAFQLLWVFVELLIDVCDATPGTLISHFTQTLLEVPPAGQGVAEPALVEFKVDTKLPPFGINGFE